MTPFSGVRLPDVLGAMALIADLGLGQSMGHLARACLLAHRLGIECGFPAGELEPIYYLSVLDFDGAGATGTQRDVTAQFARRLGLAESVCDSLAQMWAQGNPATARQGSIEGPVAVSVRLWRLADVAETQHALGGPEAASEAVSALRGTQIEPDLAERFRLLARGLLEDLPADADQAWQPVRAALPRVDQQLTDPELDVVLEAVADWVDLRSARPLGHSLAVAELAGEASRHLRLDEHDIRLVRRAGLLHDIGRLGVPRVLWTKPGTLSTADRERIRLHSYLTERTLTRPAALAQIGVVAAMAHERLDGSGYHRGLSAADLPTAARVLAVADRFRAGLEGSPRRPAATAQQVATWLVGEAASGRLDGDAVEAVLAAAGQHARRRSALGPAGLTRRESQILALLARGQTNRQIGQSLGVAQKTVGNHIQHIYSKAGVGTRAAAARFALEHGLG